MVLLVSAGPDQLPSLEVRLVTLLFLLFGGSTIASTGTPAPTLQFTVSGQFTQNVFPDLTVVSTYAAITRPTE